MKNDKDKNPAAVALGKIKSPAKAAASRANGVSGGRPSCVKLLSDLMAVATYRLPHHFQGLCPDVAEAPLTRDTGCPACRVLVKVDAFLNNTPDSATARSDVAL